MLHLQCLCSRGLSTRSTVFYPFSIRVRLPGNESLKFRVSFHAVRDFQAFALMALLKLREVLGVLQFSAKQFELSLMRCRVTLAVSLKVFHRLTLRH